MGADGLIVTPERGNVNPQSPPKAEGGIAQDFDGMAYVTVGQNRLFVEDSGAGEAIVLLSGLGGDHRAFAVTSRALAARYRVVAIDARDSGQSTRTESRYTTADLADDVAACMTSLGIRSATVLGHSLGGLIAQQFAFRHPDRLAGLILVSSHASTSPWKRGLVDSWIILKRRVDAAEFARCTLPWLVGPAFFNNPGLVEGMVRFAEKNPIPQEAEAFERQAAAAIAHDSRPQLGSIQAPALVISGMADLVNPPTVAADLAALIPGAGLILLEGVGHLPHIEDGPAFRGAVEAFLAEHAGSGVAPEPLPA
jgi:3-oxoadipate enol-lactonase